MSTSTTTTPVSLYSSPNCAQCNMTKKQLKTLGVAFEEYDITRDEEARAMISALGYKSVPVVVHGTDHWSGFRLDRLKALVS